VAFVGYLSALPGHAQTTSRGEDSESVSGYLPTPTPVVEKMLEMARVRPGEKVFDLGSGDGRIVIAAAQKHGAKGVGIELKPELVRLSRARIQEAGLSNQVQIIEGSFFSQDLSPADVITVYLDPASLTKVSKYLAKFLRHGMRVVVCEGELPGLTSGGAERVLDKESNKAYRIVLYEISQPDAWTSFGSFGTQRRRGTPDQPTTSPQAESPH
jgi:protein-L-isoaspartate O-methyltransferase